LEEKRNVAGRGGESTKCRFQELTPAKISENGGEIEKKEDNRVRRRKVRLARGGGGRNGQGMSGTSTKERSRNRGRKKEGERRPVFWGNGGGGGREFWGY